MAPCASREPASPPKRRQACDCRGHPDRKRLGGPLCIGSEDCHLAMGMNMVSVVVKTRFVRPCDRDGKVPQRTDKPPMHVRFWHVVAPPARHGSGFVKALGRASPGTHSAVRPGSRPSGQPPCGGGCRHPRGWFPLGASCPRRVLPADAAPLRAPPVRECRTPCGAQSHRGQSTLPHGTALCASGSTCPTRSDRRQRRALAKRGTSAVRVRSVSWRAA